MIGPIPQPGPADGRFAPSPTGDLHLGNLRTALLAWLFARAAGGRFILRVEDLDPERSRTDLAHRQVADLAALGIDWDGEVVWQSQRLEMYREAVAKLEQAGLVYECWCTRAEILAAASAPHGEQPEGAYPGTCAALTRARREQLRFERGGPALRLRAGGVREQFVDRLLGAVESVVDDFVLVRKDGVCAYNVAVVVDDALQGIGCVVRGADLASATPRQILLQRLLGLPHPDWAHVPLVLGPDGRRLAKRDGAVTLEARSRLGESPAFVRGLIAATLGLAEPGEQPSPEQLVRRFDPKLIGTEPTIWR